MKEIKSAIGVHKTHLFRHGHMKDCNCVSCSSDKTALAALRTMEWIFGDGMQLIADYSDIQAKFTAFHKEMR